MKKFSVFFTLVTLLLSYSCTHTIFFHQDQTTEPDVDKDDNIVTVIPYNQIWYKSKSGVINPYDFTVFGANVIESNKYDSNFKYIMTFDQDKNKVGNNAFLRCDLTGISLPNSVTLIGKNAFAYCSNLTNIDFPDQITTIDSDAFQKCGFETITIPESITTIGENPFRLCDKLVKFNGKLASEDGKCLILDRALKSFASKDLLTYTIPGNVTTICHGAFYGADLTSVIIPNSVTTIEGEAFKNCNSLKNITIPDSVTSIGDEVFYGCSNLVGVTLSKNVKSIAPCCFYDCYSLTNITIPDNVITIEHHAFYNCSNLKNITIPDSVTTIEEYAFSGCDNLTEVTIGSNVTTIGSWAFYNNRDTQHIYCKALTPPKCGDHIFGHFFSNQKIYVPRVAIDAYKAAYGWKEYVEVIEAYDF